MSYRLRKPHFNSYEAKAERGFWVVITSPIWLGALWLLGEIGRALGWTPPHR